MRQNPDDLGELYHVTYYKNLESIAEHGLVAGHGGAIGRGGYSGHSKGRVFLTDLDGVFFWMGRYEAFAEHDSENPLEDGLVPVVIEVGGDIVAQLVADGRLIDDELGSRDAMGQAYYVEDLIITPDELLIWNGKEWATIDDGSIDPQSSFKWVEDDDFDEGGFWQFGDLNDLPLLPPEARK